MSYFESTTNKVKVLHHKNDSSYPVIRAYQNPNISSYNKKIVIKYNLPLLRMEINTSNQIFIKVHEKQFNDRKNHYTTNVSPTTVRLGWKTLYTFLMWSMTFLF